jgi:hypothetical protein
MMKLQADHVRLKEMENGSASVPGFWLMIVQLVDLDVGHGGTARVNPVLWARAQASHHIFKLFAQKKY